MVELYLATKRAGRDRGKTIACGESKTGPYLEVICKYIFLLGNSFLNKLYWQCVYDLFFIWKKKANEHQMVNYRRPWMLGVLFASCLH